MQSTVDAIKNNQATLIDIREAYELEDYGALEQAKHIPMGEIPTRIEEIKAFKQPIVVFCKSGGRASKVVEFLQENGIEDIYNGGGYEDINGILQDSEA